MNDRRRIIVGITGATGIAYELRVLEFLRAADVETHLVVSKAGHLTRSYETSLSARDLETLADVNYAPADIGAAIASGSFRLQQGGHQGDGRDLRPRCRFSLCGGQEGEGPS